MKIVHAHLAPHPERLLLLQGGQVWGGGGAERRVELEIPILLCWFQQGEIED